MEETLFEYIGWIIAFLFMVLPRILKRLTSRTKAAPPKKPKQPKQKPVIDLEDLLGTNEIDLGPQTADTSRIEALLSTATQALSKARELERLIQSRGGASQKILNAVETSCTGPSETIVRTLKSSMAEGNLPTTDDTKQIQANLDRILDMTRILERLVDRRLRPEWAQILDTLDSAAQECLVPYLAHASRLGLPYPTRLAVVVLGEPGDNLADLLHSANIAPVVIPEKTTERPSAWAHMASDVALDLFYSTRGLARRIATEMQVLPAPLSLTHYSDERSLIAGLMGGWLPRLFADTGAALYLGPGFAAGLVRWLDSNVSAEQAVTTVIGDRLHAVLPPHHLRVFIACRVLQHLGMEEDAEKRFFEWNRRIGEPEQLIIKGEDDTTGDIPLSHVLDAVSHMVDTLMNEPIAQLGGLPLAHIPSLRCDITEAQKMKEVAAYFLDSKPVDLPGRTIIGAAQLATEKSNALEQRISKAALKSLAGKGKSMERRPDVEEGPQNLGEMLQSPKFIVKALITQAAIGPRTIRHGKRL